MQDNASSLCGLCSASMFLCSRHALFNLLSTISMLGCVQLAVWSCQLWGSILYVELFVRLIGYLFLVCLPEWMHDLHTSCHQNCCLLDWRCIHQKLILFRFLYCFDTDVSLYMHPPPVWRPIGSFPLFVRRNAKECRRVFLSTCTLQFAVFIWAWDVVKFVAFVIENCFFGLHFVLEFSLIAYTFMQESIAGEFFHF